VSLSVVGKSLWILHCSRIFSSFTHVPIFSHRNGIHFGSATIVCSSIGTLDLKKERSCISMIYIHGHRVDIFKEKRFQNVTTYNGIFLSRVFTAY
jgi:hypothetical protein